MRLVGSSGDVESRGLFLIHARTHFKQTKKKIAPVCGVVVITRRGITYGIRAGSTRDLGFATAFVDLIRLILLLLIDLIVCTEVIMDRQCHEGRRRVLEEEA
jgi:hypothetical protein